MLNEGDLLIAFGSEQFDRLNGLIVGLFEIRQCRRHLGETAERHVIREWNRNLTAAFQNEGQLSHERGSDIGINYKFQVYNMI